MNYRSDIERCIEFIEANIKEELIPEHIASLAGYSLVPFLPSISSLYGNADHGV
ncbi:hypothetical protein [Paenibacillus monticola]|uniref:Uncharacterized protein n=1 Tax=Paenibacillus monticola TaxID=2666075 RepID=A0A7X2HAK2_9BACL|nr:hypothetical protein [Paenibacillus monticola]MRN56564.1 hypothetical protein [Paenibacillus monticola]